MRRSRTNPDFLNGVPELLVLRLLRRRPMYGYEIVKAIESATGAELSFGEGCIYPVLHKLEAEGSLNAERQTVGGRSRVVYQVTKAGDGRLEKSTAEWQRIADAIRLVLSGGEHEAPAFV